MTTYNRKEVSQIQRLQSAFTRLHIVRELLDEAYPDILGPHNNPPELIELYKSLSWLEEEAGRKFKEVGSEP